MPKSCDWKMTQLFKYVIGFFVTTTSDTMIALNPWSATYDVDTTIDRYSRVMSSDDFGPIVLIRSETGRNDAGTLEVIWLNPVLSFYSTAQQTFPTTDAAPVPLNEPNLTVADIAW
jgi:hypothetical protein